MFLLFQGAPSQLPPLTPQPAKPYGQALKDNIPIIAVGSVMAVVCGFLPKLLGFGGTAVAEGIGASRAFSFIRWGGTALGAALAVGGFFPSQGKNGSTTIIPPEAAPPPENFPEHAFPESDTDTTTDAVKPKPAKGYYRSFQEWRWDSESSREDIESYVSGGLTKERYVKRIAWYLEHYDSTVRKEAAKGLVEGVYGNTGASEECAQKANYFLREHLFKKDVDKDILKGVVEGIEKVYEDVPIELKSRFDSLRRVLEEINIASYREGCVPPPSIEDGPDTLNSDYGKILCSRNLPPDELAQCLSSYFKDKKELSDGDKAVLNKALTMLNSKIKITGTNKESYKQILDVLKKVNSDCKPDGALKASLKVIIKKLETGISAIEPKKPKSVKLNNLDDLKAFLDARFKNGKLNKIQEDALKKILGKLQALEITKGKNSNREACIKLLDSLTNIHNNCEMSSSLEKQLEKTIDGLNKKITSPSTEAKKTAGKKVELPEDEGVKLVPLDDVSESDIEEPALNFGDVSEGEELDTSWVGQFLEENEADNKKDLSSGRQSPGGPAQGTYSLSGEVNDSGKEKSQAGEKPNPVGASTSSKVQTNKNNIENVKKQLIKLVAPMVKDPENEATLRDLLINPSKDNEAIKDIKYKKLMEFIVEALDLLGYKKESKLFEYATIKSISLTPEDSDNVIKAFKSLVKDEIKSDASLQPSIDSIENKKETLQELAELIEPVIKHDQGAGLKQMLMDAENLKCVMEDPESTSKITLLYLRLSAWKEYQQEADLIFKAFQQTKPLTNDEADFLVNSFRKIYNENKPASSDETKQTGASAPKDRQALEANRLRDSIKEWISKLNNPKATNIQKQSAAMYLTTQGLNLKECRDEVIRELCNNSKDPSALAGITKGLIDRIKNVYDTPEYKDLAPVNQLIDRLLEVLDDGETKNQLKELKKEINDHRA